MVARNYPFQQISNIITKWETKEIKTVSEKLQDELEPINSPMSDEQNGPVQKEKINEITSWGKS